MQELPRWRVLYLGGSPSSSSQGINRLKGSRSLGSQQSPGLRGKSLCAGWDPLSLRSHWLAPWDWARSRGRSFQQRQPETQLLPGRESVPSESFPLPEMTLWPHVFSACFLTLWRLACINAILWLICFNLSFAFDVVFVSVLKQAAWSGFHQSPLGSVLANWSLKSMAD